MSRVSPTFQFGFKPAKATARKIPLTTPVVGHSVFASPAQFIRLAIGGPTDAATTVAKPIELASVARWQKDVLNVGEFKTPDGHWSFGLAELNAIATNFKAAQSRGVSVPVILAKPGAQQQHEELALHKIGEVDDVFVDKGKLFCKLWTCSASDPVVYQLDLLKHQVSVEVWKNWADGQGNRYPLFLKHLAVVTHPVVHPQEQFIRMALNSKATTKQATNQKPVQQQRRIRMAEEAKTEGAATGGDAGGGAAAEAAKYDGNSKLSDVYSELTGALKELGFLIPDVPVDEFMLTLRTMVSLKKASEEAAADTAVEDGADGSAAMAADAGGAGGAVQMSISTHPQLAAMQAEIDALKAEKAAFESATKEQTRQVFTASLMGHVKRGAIGQSQVQQLAADGAKCGYPMAMLTGLDLIPDRAAVPTGKTRVARMASGSPPPLSADPAPKEMTDERAKELAKQTRRW